ncbi:MAG TPA: hypothetical protein EYP78_03235, partial [Candidatus Omnitrophica bacterium]|nr:hypothetical protein [Candidatus Omnitrophota bacterium]
MKKLLLIGFLVMVISANIYAASMQAPSIGAKATGMSGAFTAVADDPSSLYWNPAGLGMCEGTMLMKGNAFIIPVAYYEVENADKEKNITPVQIIPNCFFTHDLNDSFSFGLGYYSPFGLKQIWKDDSELRYNSTRSEIWLNTLQIGVSYKIYDNLFVGGGIGKNFAKLRSKSFVLFRAIPPLVPNPVDGYVKLSGEDEGYSGSIGFLWEASPQWKIGGVWRSQTEINFEGELDLKYPDEYEHPLIGLNRDEDDFTLDFTFPASASLGVAYNPTDRLLLSGQVDWTNWSVIDTLEVELDTVDDLEFVRDWKDRYSFRLGAEYEVNPKFTVRGGYMWDPSPVPEDTLDPLMFDLSTNRFSLGASFRFWKLDIDAAYSLAQGIKREAEDSENIPATDGD